jgi:raffinose/stachyose/melibiose transport system substrate-binding protein
MFRKTVLLAGVFGVVLGVAGMSAQSKVTITFWDLPDQKVVLAPMIADFQAANPNITVDEVTYQVDPFKQALKIGASSNTMPDVWFNWGGGDASFYAQNGVAADLTKVSKDHGWAKIYNSAALALSTFGGKVSGVPFHLNAMGFYYSKDIYAKLKLTVPKTFAQFESNLKAIKAANLTPIAVGFKNGWHAMRITEALIERFGGPKLHDDLLTLKASWTDPAVVKALAKMKEWGDAGYFSKGYISLDPSEVQTAFYQNTVGHILEGGWYDGMMAAGGLSSDSIGFFAMPTDQTPVRVSSFAEMLQISARSSADQQAAAIKFAEFLTSKANLTKYSDTFGSVATLGVPSSSKLPNGAAITQAANTGSFQVADQALASEIVQKLFEVTDKVMLNLLTPQQAAAALQATVDSVKKK